MNFTLIILILWNFIIPVKQQKLTSLISFKSKKQPWQTRSCIVLTHCKRKESQGTKTKMNVLMRGRLCMPSLLLLAIVKCILSLETITTRLRWAHTHLYIYHSQNQIKRKCKKSKKFLIIWPAQETTRTKKMKGFSFAYFFNKLFQKKERDSIFI